MSLTRSHQLGKTGIMVAPLSLGGAAFSDIYGLYDEVNNIRFIQDCLFRGINYIETSPWYGQGTSELTIGKALKGVKREVYVIGSKIGRYDKDVRKMFNFSSERTIFAVDQTLERLGISYLDLIQIHDVSFANIDTILHETLPALKSVVEAGKARFIGLADYDIELMKTIVEESEVPIATVLSYAKSTLIDNRLQQYAAYFKSRGVGVINAAPTGMGLLTNAGPRSWHPANAATKEICAEAAKICQANNVELANLASWFSLRQPDIDTTICGFSNLEQLAESVRVYKRGLTDREETVLQELQMRFFSRPNMHWDTVEVMKYQEDMAALAQLPPEFQ